MSRLGNHRSRPALSEAAKAKPQIEALYWKIRAAKARNDLPTVEKLEAERAWLIANSLR